VNVPLIVHTIVKNKQEKLNIWRNGEQKIINAPIRPYYYSYDELDVPAIKKSVEAVALSSYEKKLFYKYEFDTREQLVAYRNEKTFEDNIPFAIRHRVDIPALYTKFPHSTPLKFLFFDIEQYTKPGKMFPYYDDRITSIAYCTNDRKIKCIYLGKDKTTDKELLLKFIEVYKRIDPDVLVVYNRTYDIPTILYRCQKNRISTVHFSKNNEKPYFGGKDAFNIEGVLIYDVLLSAREDQSLTGNVSDKGLKAVSNWFGFKEERKPLTPKQMSELQGTKELVEYNKDDVRRLLLVFDVYWLNIEFNANDLKIPLNLAVNLNTTDLGLIVIGDEYRQQNIIADGDNSTRYPEIFQRKKTQYESNYQGALIDITRSGRFEPVYKADYSSMYPTIEADFNLSPDTTTLVEFAPYDGKFKIKEEENRFVYEIPDNVLMKNMIIKVSKRQGFISKLVDRFLKERAEYKRLWKETGDPKYRAISDNRKVKANGTYGIMGSPKHAFGFAPIAIATTGIGRECAQLLIDVLNKLYPNSVLEADSVSGDTPVFIRDKETKEIDIVPIEDLSDGSLRRHIDNLETLTRSGWKNLEYVYCHEVSKKIYTIDMSQARVDVTRDHSVLVDGKLMQSRNLKPKKDSLDIYPSEDYGGNNTEINEDNAWLLGFFIAEGTANKHKPNKKVFFNKDGLPRKLRKADYYDFSICQKEPELLIKSSKIIEKEYGFSCKLYDTRKSSAVFLLEGWNKNIKKIINYCYCNDLKTKKVPKQILNAPINIVNSFLEGLMDGDGHINKDGRWCICSKSKPLMSGVAYLFDRIGKTYNVLCRNDMPHITSLATHTSKKYKNSNRWHCPFYPPGRITKIIKSDKRKKKVYDLSTEDGTFIAGVGRVICHNTDGVYYTTDNFNEQETINLFHEQLRKKFKKDLDLSIDIDSYDVGYFYKAKNYVLKKGDKIIYHGTAMKASSKDLLSSTLIKSIAKAKLEGESTDDIIRKYQKLDFPLQYFAMNITLGRPLYKYANINSLAPRLARIAKSKLGIEPVVGTQYHYIKSKSGYTLFDLAKKEDIDVQYYRDEVDKVVKIFNITPVMQSLDKWL